MSAARLPFLIAKHPTFRQLVRFGCVGVAAAATNFAVVILLVTHAKLHPLIANIFAFFIAFQVSFYGHRLWTFASVAKHLTSLAKYLMVAIASFGLNEGFYALFLQGFKIHYITALFLVLVIVPPITFLLSKFWAFAT